MNLVPLWLVRVATLLVSVTLFLWLPDSIFGLVVLLLAGMKLGDIIYHLGDYLHKKINGIEEEY